MNPFGRDYRLTDANSTIIIGSDGIVEMHENIGYYFKGCYHEVYRQPEISRYPINNPYIVHISAYCQPNCTVQHRSFEIAGLFGDICDQSARFFVDYDVSNGLVVGQDFVEFHYKVWGKQWDRPLGKLTGKIVLSPNIDSKKVLVYFNPKDTVSKYHIEGDTVYFTASNLNHYLEVRLLLPKEAFLSTANMLLDDSLLKQNVIDIQKKYDLEYLFFRISVILLYFVIAPLIVLIVIFLFRKYGKEPKINYNGIYEREPIKGWKHYIINSLCMGKTGETDKNVIPAIILDLIRRKQIILTERSETKKGIFGGLRIEKRIILTFSANAKDVLSTPEQFVYDFLKKFANDNNELVWSEFILKLNIMANAKEYLDLEDKVDHAVSLEYDIKQYFDDRGNVLFKRLCFFGAIVGAIFTFFALFKSDFSNFPIASWIIAFPIVLLIGSAIGLFLSEKIFGRFTPEGYEVYKRSLNFKKFMTDLTLLKKYPPASIVIWEEQLVYATTFGVASEVIKNFKLVVPEQTLKSSNMYPLYATAHLSMLSSLHNISYTTAHPSSSGGGGFGGGGGAR
jgi:uncharacterized membrane protein